MASAFSLQSSAVYSCVLKLYCVDMQRIGSLLFFLGATAGRQGRVCVYAVDSRPKRTSLYSYESRGLNLFVQAELFDSLEDVVERTEHHAEAEALFNGKKVVAGVTRASGGKCQRCWNYSSAVGTDSEHPALCERCAPVIRDLGFKLPTPASAVAA